MISEGKVYTWGSNLKGQLGHQSKGIGEVNLSATIVSCGSEYTIILTVDGELMISGKLPF